jgi:signal transduction histidine kinase
MRRKPPAPWSSLRLHWRLRLLRFGVLAIGCWMFRPGLAEPVPALVLDSAVLVARLDPARPVDLSADRPPADAVADPVGLPHRLRRADGNTQGVFWYRIDLPPLAAMPPAPAIFLPRLNDGGTIYLNGQVVLRIPASDALKRVRWRKARAVALPMNALQADANVLTVKLINRDFSVSFPDLLLGSHDELQAQVEKRQWLDQYGSQFTGITAMIIGAFILCIWWFRRDERYYLLFGLSSLLWAVRTLNYSVEVIPTSIWWWWRGLHFLVVAAATGTLAAFFLSFAGLKMRRGAIVFCIFGVAGPAAVVLSNGHLHDAVYIWWQGPLFLLIIAALARFAWWGYHHRSVEVLLITIGVLLATALAANDYATMIGVAAHTRVYTLHLALPVLLLTIGSLLTIRFVRALRSSEDSNLVLAERLAEKERELADQFEQMRLVEQRKASAAERQRIMQDMHDGLGAQLVSSLVMVERGGAKPSEIAMLLRESLDEMRLAIDAFGQAEVDLVGGLAGLRHRMEPRLMAAGMSLRWTMDSMFAQLRPDEHSALQLLRIVQEALSNAIKHSGATELRVRFESDERHLRILVADNGSGFGDHGPPARTAASGLGLAGLRKRAHALSGDVAIDTSVHGTTVVVSVPLQSLARPESLPTAAATTPVVAAMMRDDADIDSLPET